MRRLAIIAFAFSAAVFLAQHFFDISLSFYLGAGSAVLFLALFLIKQEKARLVKLIILGLALGFLWNFGYDEIFLAPARALHDETGNVTVRITDYPEENDYGYRMDVKLIIDKAPDITAVLYIYFEDYFQLEPGDMITVEAKAVMASKKSDEDYYSPKGVFLLLYSKQSPLLISKNNSSLLYYPVKLSKIFNETIEKIFPDDIYPFMKALLTGDRSDLNRDSYILSVLSTTGASHAVAVSGMHLVYLVGLIQFFIGKNKKTAFICIPLIIFYMAMVGNTPSVMRAGIMQIMLLIAPLLMREYDRLTALGFSLLFLLILNPISVKHAGLQLSFASVLGIILFTDRLQGYLTAFFTERKWVKPLFEKRFIRSAVRFIISSIAVTLAAMIFVIPLTALNFGQVSIIAPLTNLLILPALSFVFSFGVIVVTIGIIYSPLASILSLLVTIPVRYILLILKLLENIPLAAVYSRNVYISAWLICFYIILTIVILTPKLKRKPLLLALPAVIMLSISLGLTYIETNNCTFSATALDVGQGQSIVLTSNGKTAVVDCGGNRMKNAGDNAAEYLLSLGKRRLDILILTHFHTDHANGVLQLLRRIKVDTLIVPKIPGLDALQNEILQFAEDSGVRIICIQKDTEIIKLGSMELSLYPPLGTGDRNEQGLCIKCTSDDFNMLITGDIDAESEIMLLEYADIPDIDLLIAGHHGSNGSTSRELLGELKPELVIISTGYNSYGHPGKDTLARLYDAGIKVYRTDLSGEINLISN